VKIVSHRRQRTLARPAEVRGTGYLTGKQVRLRFLPAPASSGVVFVRTDHRPGAPIAAHVANVTGTHRRTTIGDGPFAVGLVEHVLAALAGLHIDNCRIELDAPEPPGLDGSSLAFVDALVGAGCILEDAERPLWAATHPITVQQGGATLTLHPPEDQELRISYILDYGAFSPIAPQTFTSDIEPGAFRSDIACARTFLLEQEAEMLRQQGLGRRTRFSDLIVFGPNGPLNNRLRFANEPARHKVLDLIGDLCLAGHLLCGRVVAYRSGHPLNVELAREIAERIDATRGVRRRAA
jgi:UDP-3-O-acyl N-acetylglucosamine deacetylase